MNFDATTIVSLIAALGIGSVLSAIVGYFKDRKKNDSDSNKTDVDTKLAYLNTVIERLDQEVKRVIADRDRIEQERQEERTQFHAELKIEQDRNLSLRKRVRELEDEIDGVRRSARETQHKCDELATRLQELVNDAQEQ